MGSSCIRRICAVLGASAGVIIASTTWGSGQTVAPAGRGRIKTDPTINEPFKKPDLKGFIAKFESNDREVYARRHEIVAAVGLKPGMSVADVGAGTGLFTRLFAEKVRQTGKVYAVDISPQFLRHIASESRKRGQAQVATVLGSQDQTNLPKESVDVAFMSDTYHHLERPEKLLESIREALRPDGLFVVVEFDRVEGRSSAFVLKHVRAGQAVFRREIEAAGFRFVPTPGAPLMKENFFLRFQKSAHPQTRR
jgi:ubiquinone/menaquinone biosynthesis C-methylase UbiE